MKNIDINFNGRSFEFYCEWKKTSSGFKHTRTVWENLHKIVETKICYLNRTYEGYTFQSVLHKAVSKIKLASKKAEQEELESEFCRKIDENRTWW